VQYITLHMIATFSGLRCFCSVHGFAFLILIEAVLVECDGLMNICEGRRGEDSHAEIIFSLHEKQGCLAICLASRRIAWRCLAICLANGRISWRSACFLPEYFCKQMNSLATRLGVCIHVIISAVSLSFPFCIL